MKSCNPDIEAVRGNQIPPRNPAFHDTFGAVALAMRMLPVADGSDFMGSLRNPAAWVKVFGFRPSQGRVPMWPATE